MLRRAPPARELRIAWPPARRGCPSPGVYGGVAGASGGSGAAVGSGVAPGPESSLWSPTAGATSGVGDSTVLVLAVSSADESTTDSSGLPPQDVTSSTMVRNAEYRLMPRFSQNQGVNPPAGGTRRELGITRGSIRRPHCANDVGVRVLPPTPQPRRSQCFPPPKSVLLITP